MEGPGHGRGTPGTLKPTRRLADEANKASVERLRSSDVRGLGRHPVALRLTGADGVPLVVAAAGGNRTALVGPFLAASMAGLPRAPREHGV